MSTLVCLTMAVYFEARGASDDLKYLVADTVMTRVEDSRYPDEVCEVIAEDGAFPWCGAPLPEITDQAWLDAQEKALIVLEEGAYYTVTHFHKDTVRPSWSGVFEKVVWVDNHWFYYNQTPYK